MAPYSLPVVLAIRSSNNELGFFRLVEAFECKKLDVKCRENRPSI